MGLYIRKNIVDNYVVFSEIKSLNTPYHVEKMKQEGVYSDFISYMDQKTEYDSHQREQEKNNQLAYDKALKNNPDLNYEEFMKHRPLNLIVQQEPQPSEALLKFKEKYIG